ncbi:MAG: gephyrin-like molybdotransferase Glp [Thermoplasmata archaeon]
MELLKNVISFRDARDLLLRNIKPVERTEKISINDCVLRVAASDIISEIDVPPFERAAMDGYAVRAEDTMNAKSLKPVILRKIGRVDAGEHPELSVSPGTCVQIATGAMLPEGSDAVVMVEHTEEEQDGVRVYTAVRKGENITRAGEDIRKGSVAIRKNEMLTPGKVGAIAALGIPYVEVYAKPEIAIIPTGNEIQQLGGKLEIGKIYDVNSYTLNALVKWAGCEPVIYDIVGDREDAIEATLRKGLRHDMVVFTGGSSVGERDLMIKVIQKKGEVLFHGIAVKPGKPTLCAIVDGKVVLGMPGYPTSCLTNAYALLLPALAKLSKRSINLHRVKAKMGQRVASTIGRLQFLPVKLEGEIAYPVFKESGAITSMANADGYIEIPENVDVVEKGEDVEVLLFHA